MGKKADARAARKAEKEAARKAKAPAFAAPPDEVKIPAAEAIPGEKGVPAVEVDPKTIRKIQPEWLFDNLCCCFPAPWRDGADWGMDVWAAHVEPKLKSYGSMTWGQIEVVKDHKNRAAPHDQHSVSLAPEAQEQLKLMGMDEALLLFRFALDREKRLWGVRETHRFRILWFDPTHLIYKTRNA
jgi:hypothetical protein